MFKKDRTDQERATTLILYCLKNKKRWQSVASTMVGEFDDTDNLTEEEVEWIDDRAEKDIAEESRRLMRLGIEADRQKKIQLEESKKRKYCEIMK